MAVSYMFYGGSILLGGTLYLLALIVPFLYKTRKSLKALKPFIHVKPHWLFGHLRIHPGPNEKGLMTNIEWAKMAPRAYTVHLGPLRPVLMLNHPDTIKQILKTNEPKTVSGGGGYKLLDPWIGDGLLTSAGDKWFRNRKLLTPGFHFDILKPYMEIYNNSVEVFLSQVRQQSEKGESLEIFRMISLLTLDVILKCAFSYDENVQAIGKGVPYIETVLSLSNLIVKRARNPIYYFDWIYYKTKNGKLFKEQCDISHDMAEMVIKNRKAILEERDDAERSNRYVDFLDILLLAKDNDGKGLTDREIRDEVETFMFEGHDTTASGISWALYNLARHPEYQHKVQEEIDSIIGDRNPPVITWDDMKKFEYLTMCIKESLRLHPPVFFIGRELTKPTVLEGQLIPKSTIMAISIWNLHHNPVVWGPDIMSYKPERFHVDNIKHMDSHAFIAFSAGQRNCIGQNFAMNEMKTTIARILHKYELSVDESHKVEMLPELILKSKNGIKLFFKERNHATK